MKNNLITLITIITILFLTLIAAFSEEEKKEEEKTWGPEIVQKATEYSNGNYGNIYYKYGAKGLDSSITSLDCSGFVSRVIHEVTGVTLNNGTNEQTKDKQLKTVGTDGTAIGDRMNDLKPGDLIYRLKGGNHVAIYVGNGNVIDASCDIDKPYETFINNIKTKLQGTMEQDKLDKLTVNIITDFTDKEKHLWIDLDKFKAQLGRNDFTDSEVDAILHAVNWVRQRPMPKKWPEQFCYVRRLIKKDTSTIEGKITSAKTGKALTVKEGDKVTIKVLDSSGKEIKSVTMSANGSYKLPDIPAGEYKISVTANIKKPKYNFKFGGSVGYHFQQLDNKINNSTTLKYTSSGASARLNVTFLPKFSENFYVYLSGFAFANLYGKLKDENGDVLKAPNSNTEADLRGYGVGARLGILFNIN